MVSVSGVDISHWQNGTIDYAKAKKAGVKWLYHKATEGTTYKDPNYAKRRAEAKANGLPFGAYHFARPKIGSATAEAKWFVKNASPKAGDMIPMLDLEVNDTKMTKAQLTGWVGNFLAELNKHKLKAVIYTPFDLNKSFGCLLWVARYNDSMIPPKVPEPWKTWDIWQFSNGELGKPDTIPGIGKCDINTARTGFDPLKSMRIAQPVPVKQLTLQHSSMQFSDSDSQHLHDAIEVFKTGNDVITGTEAGPGAGNLTKVLKAQATKAGYYFYIAPRQGNWIAVRKSLIPAGTIPRWGYQKVLSSSGATGDKYGPYSERGIVFATFRVAGLGRITVGTGHLLTKGRTREQTPAGPLNHYDLNTKYTRAIGNWAKQWGASTDLVFFNADMNMDDKAVDVFRGQPLTTVWDELKKYPDTGHGTLDVIASYDLDGRVAAATAKVLPLGLFSDHRTIEATFNVQKLN